MSAEYRIGDCREALADIEDNSVALVLTDPPYARESEHLYRWLAEWSARVLIPGGSLICYTGHWSLNRDMKILGEHLRYWWLLVMPHHQSRRLPGKFVIANFKPVLWYVKGKRRGRTLMTDVLRSPKREKEDHDWGQGEGGVTHLIEHLSEPGELILDPFAGTGTWGHIAAFKGRIGSGATSRWRAAPRLRRRRNDDTNRARQAPQRLRPLCATMAIAARLGGVQAGMSRIPCAPYLVEYRKALAERNPAAGGTAGRCL
jgi:hypothetical protein